VTAPSSKTPTDDQTDNAPPLTTLQQRFLLRIAREAVRAAAEDLPPAQYESDDPALRRPTGVFVTLRHPDGELRGCIGYVQSHRPLIQTVALAAASAASRDPRFLPVQPEEVDSLHIEISLLSTPVTVNGPEQVEVGIHGLIVSEGMTRGLLLPQVAVEHGWDAGQFLTETCRKANLPGDAWRKGKVRIEAFKADVFRSDDIK